MVTITREREIKTCVFYFFNPWFNQEMKDSKKEEEEEEEEEEGRRKGRLENSTKLETWGCNLKREEFYKMKV